MWPFRRKKTRRIPVSQHTFAGSAMGVFFHTKPNPGIRFPLQTREIVSVTVSNDTRSDVTVHVRFNPADEVIEDLVRSATEIELTRNGETFVRLPVMVVARGGGSITVTAHNDRRDQ